MWQKICRLVIKYNNMNLNNFTLKAQESVQKAFDIAGLQKVSRLLNVLISSKE